MADENATAAAGGADLGGLVIPEDTDKSAAGSGSAGSAAETVIQGRRRGRPPGSKNNGGGKSTAVVPALSFEQFKQLYSPDLWGNIAAAPANAAAALTGKEFWRFTEEEKKGIGEPLSIVAQLYSTTDPRIIAVIAAITTLGTAYAARIAKHVAEKKAAKEAQQNKGT